MASSSVDNVETKLANDVVTSLNLQAVCVSNVSASRVDVHTATDLSKLAQHKGKSVLNLSVRGPLRCATCACSPTRILGIDAKYAGGSGVRCALCVTTTGRELIRGFSLVADRASTSGTVQNVRSRTPPVAYLNAPCARRIWRFGAGIASRMRRLPNSSVNSASRVRWNVNTVIGPSRRAQH